MKIDIETLRDTFKISYQTLEASRIEAMEVMDLYHNRQYTDAQLTILENRGQPKETFNVVKMFGRMLLGYYSTIVNEVIVTPRKEDQIINASILNDLTNHVFETNNFRSEGDKIKLDAILTGLMCSYVTAQKTGEKDQFGRPKYSIIINHIPSLEIFYDPMSQLDDFSDTRWIGRFKWLSEEAVVKAFGKDKVKELDAYHNHLDTDESEFTYAYNGEFIGQYKRFNNYLIVQTIIEDDNGKTWSIFWSGDQILDKKEITYKEVKSPYRLHRLHNSNRAEHYGIFREVVETQHAINQAIVKIQLMVNTQKAFVEDGAVENIVDFSNQFNRVNAIIPVKDLQGIRIENLSREVADQYTIIDRALNRIQRILSINDSFLGMAYASDSGSKVKLQQNASVIALRYVTAKVEQFYRLLGIDVINLIKQYYTAHDVVRIADNYTGQRWIEINKPIMRPTGNVDPRTGQAEMKPVLEEIIDPNTGKVLKDEAGNIVMAPIPTKNSEIAFTDADVSVESIAYDDEDEKNALMLEQFINGPIGQMMAQVNPVAYFKAGKLAVKNVKSKYSLELSELLDETAQLLQQPQGQPANAAMQAGQVNGQMTPQASATARRN
jgi:hypothetical protein